MTATHQTFLAAGPEQRVQLVEALITESVKALRPGQPANFDGSTHIADLAIDSIQLVEMKFALDEFVGIEIDVGAFIANPTVHELATIIVAACAQATPTSA